MSELQLITASRLKAGRACKRLHHLEYDLGYRPAVDADELRFGTLLHLGLEYWWVAARSGVVGQERLDIARTAVENAGADEFDRAKALVLITGYHYRWHEEPYEVLAVEEQFEAPLINPESKAASRTWRLAGKLDVVVRDLRDGLVKLMEHKTSSEDITPGSEYWRRLRMDSQVSIYFDGARARGHEVAECVYDVIGKPALRPGQVPVVDSHGVKVVVDAAGQRVRTKDGKKWRESADTAQGFVLKTRPETVDEYEERLAEAVGANPEKYFARGIVVRLEAELDEHRFDVWQTTKEIREGQVAKRFPRNPDSCKQYGRTCVFFDVCTGAGALDDPRRFKRLENPHPELVKEASDVPVG